jgi:hypothetical protein
MFGIISWFREIRIGVFYARVLIAMSQLFFEPNVAVVIVLFWFDRAFRPVRIVL